jgi:hypothetical protein
VAQSLIVATPPSIASSAGPAPAVPTPQPLLPFTIVSADSFNPKFKAHHPKAQEIYLEEILDEKITAKMTSKDASPLAFVVPDGCDSVQFSYGHIELNPGVGKPYDLDQIVTVGEAAISADAADVDSGDLGPLIPGGAIVVAIPWRAASWVDLPANRLKVTVHAKFFDSTQTPST